MATGVLGERGGFEGRGLEVSRLWLPVWLTEGIPRREMGGGVLQNWQVNGVFILGGDSALDKQRVGVIWRNMFLGIKSKRESLLKAGRGGKGDFIDKLRG